MGSVHLAWERVGSGDAPVVLWLHGFLGDRRDWRGIVEKIHGFQHVLVDLPGHGESAALVDDAPAFDRLTRSLSALVFRLQPVSAGESPAIVGYSLGARVAMALVPVLAHAGQLGKVALISGHPGLRNSAERAARLAVDVHRAAALRQSGLPAFVDHWYTLPLLRSLKSLPNGASIIARRSVGDAEARARTLLALSTGHQPNRLTTLQVLGESLLWVAGAEDQTYASLLTEAHAATPGSALRLIECAGHHVHLVQPAHCVALLQAHLTGRRS